MYGADFAPLSIFMPTALIIVFFFPDYSYLISNGHNEETVILSRKITNMCDSVALTVLIVLFLNYSDSNA